MTIAVTSATRHAPGHSLTAATPSDFNIAATSLAHRTRGALEDVVLLLFVTLLLPVAILVIGTPVALCVRLVVAIVRRF
jgi:hypothetical protein